MVLPNLVFDVLLFGVLAIAALLDLLVPGLAGVLGLAAVGGTLYIAAQEWCDALGHRKLLAPESLATSIATTTAGFLYFWGRNGSDFALLLLSIGLMMASLMAAIAVIAALGAAFREKSSKPLTGLLLTVAGALALGIAGGVLTLDSRLLLGVALVGFIAWKAVEAVARRSTADLPGLLPDAEPESRAAWERPTRPIESPESIAPIVPPTSAPAPTPRLVSPQRGTLLNRLLPTLLLGLLAFLVWRAVLPGTHGIQSPAVADNR